MLIEYIEPEIFEITEIFLTDLLKKKYNHFCYNFVRSLIEWEFSFFVLSLFLLSA